MATFYIGQIIPFGGNFAINGMTMCSGQLLNISQFTALFSIIGTFYGGNGTSNFAVPDLRGRRMIHQGTGLGLSPYVIGEQGGAENVSILTSNLPQHTHTVSGTFSASGTQPKASLQAPAANAVLGHADDVSTNSPLAKPAIYCPAGTATSVTLGGMNISAGLTGNNLPVSILNPYLCVTMLLVLNGVFPSRN